MNPPTRTPPRPLRRDTEVVRAAAEKLAPQVLAWCQDETADLAVITADLVKAIRWNDDGYDIAKSLDDYSPDAELVEILDAAGMLVTTAWEAACREWVTAHNITGPEVGALVSHTRKKDAGLGEVIRNEPDGRSVVFFPDLGHVKQGTGYLGLYVEWELLKPV
jgi:hypothetical protein